MTPPKVVHLPYIPHLQESNVRTGCFEHNEYLALKSAPTSHLKPVVIMAYNTGMRKEEILCLQWSHVNLVEGKITLRPEDTKNRESRVILMEGELLVSIRFQKSQRDRYFPNSPWVFFTPETGGKIGSFRNTWMTACRKVGLQDSYFMIFVERLSETW